MMQTKCASNKSLIGIFILVTLNSLIFVFSAQASVRGNRRLTEYEEILTKVDSDFAANKILKRTYGYGWSVWDKQSIIKGLYLKCSWTNYRIGGKSLPMCVHPEDDTISRAIRDVGYWNECEGLHQMWLNNGGNNDNIFVDIGSNIGSCVMHFLMHTDANIIAFEPNPRNLFCLTSTLGNLDYEYQKRVTLFPVGLGSNPSTSLIFGLKNNLGHSSISLNANVHTQDRFHHAELIHVERLDSIVNAEALSNEGIRLMKIDVEGFECHVLDGVGKEILSHVRLVHSEVSMSEHKCTSKEYVQKLKDAGFKATIESDFGEGFKTYIATNLQL